MTQTASTLKDWREVKIQGFMGLVGPLLRSKKPEERTLYGLRTNETHKNAIGTVHGGVITSFLDQVIALAAWNAADRQPTVTIQMDTRFLSAAKTGDFLKARAEIRQATGTLMFVDADVYCDEKSIACATAVLKIIRHA